MRFLRAHRTNDLFDETDFVFGQAVLLVQLLVGPWLVEVLHWNKRVNLARRVLGWLVQKNQEASQSAGEVGQDAFSLTLGAERSNGRDTSPKRCSPGLCLRVAERDKSMVSITLTL